MSTLSGTISGSPSYITKWNVMAICTQAKSASYSYTFLASGTGTSYSIDTTPITEPFLILATPWVDYSWQASRYAVLNDIVVPANPDATPYLFKATTLSGPGGNTANPFATLSLLHLEGTPGSLGTIVDSSLNTSNIVSVSGTVPASGYTTAGAKFGSTAYTFDGTPSNFFQGHWSGGSVTLTSDFTFECFITYPSTASQINCAFFQLADISDAARLLLASDATAGTKLVLKLWDGTAWADIINATATFTRDTPTHVALVRSAGRLDLYAGGTRVGSAVTAANTTTGTGIYTQSFGSTYIFGDTHSGLDICAFSVDEVRLLDVAAYSGSSLTVPTTAFAIEGSTSGTSEPTWNTTMGATTTDNQVVWTCLGPLIDPVIIGPKVPV